MGKPEFLELLAFRSRADSCRRHGADHLAADGGAGGAGVVRHAQLSMHAPTRLQTALEGVVLALQEAIEGAAPGHATRLLPFIGTLWIFIGAANLIGLVPGLRSPTSDLSLTVALAMLVFLSVHWFGIRIDGLSGLSAPLSRAQSDPAAVSPAGRDHPYAGPGRAPVRQHDESGDGRAAGAAGGGAFSRRCRCSCCTSSRRWCRPTFSACWRWSM